MVATKVQRVSNLVSLLFVLVVVAALSVHAYGAFTGGHAKPRTSASSSTLEKGTIQVAIKGLAYPNGNRTVAVGTTVVWSNSDIAQHTVTASDHTFASTKLNKGQAYSHTFRSIGKYDYACTIHPFMKASITVLQLYGRG